MSQTFRLLLFLKSILPSAASATNRFQSKFLAAVSSVALWLQKSKNFPLGLVWFGRASTLFNNKRSLFVPPPRCGRFRLPAHVLKALPPPISTDLDLGYDEPEKASDNPVPLRSSVSRAGISARLIKRPGEYTDRLITNYQELPSLEK